MPSIDQNKRYQSNYNLIDRYPCNGPYCACGCGTELKGRQTRWASRQCADKAYQEFAIIKGNGDAIRRTLYETDKGYCRSCGVYDEHWEADHIIPVHQGGGACDISNYQTLCRSCHIDKTNNQRK